MEKFGDEWRKRNAELYDRYKKAQPYAGFSFFKKTSTPCSWLIVSRHYPWELCWSWYVEFRLLKPSLEILKWSLKKPIIWWKSPNGNRQISFRFLFAELAYHSQNYGPHIVERFFYEEEKVN